VPRLADGRATFLTPPSRALTWARSAGYGCAPATASAAVTMTSVTACGWEIMITCEPSTSVMPAPAR
jgi:hypothetical protein